MFARARDWYVVEERSWSDEAITNVVYGTAYPAIDKLKMEVHGLTLTQRSSTSATLTHQSGATCFINQTVFEDVNAARLYFRKQVGLRHYATTFGKLYLWRIVAKSRRRALVLPPLQYRDHGGEMLLDYPRSFYDKPNPGMIEYEKQRLGIE